MKRRALLILFALILVGPMAGPAGAYGSGQRNDSETKCGSLAGLAAVNCATLSITASTGSCASVNLGMSNETLQCTAGTYTVSATLYSWINPGSYTLSFSGRSGCSLPSPVSASWTTTAPPTVGPYTIYCNAFTVNYGFCSQAWAGASMSFGGSFAPSSMSVSASINQVSDGCVPNHP